MMALDRALPLLALGTGLLAGCMGQTGGERAGGPPGPVPGGIPGINGPGGIETADIDLAYEKAGLLASTGAFPFSGNISYYSGPSPDSTLAVLTLSFADRVLTFVREGERYRASYEARVEALRDNNAIRVAQGVQTVRVLSFAETTRRTESVIFQQVLNLPPGKYTLQVDLHDNASARSANKQFQITVPTMGPTSLSTPMTVYQAYPRDNVDSVPRLIAAPRSTVTWGRDTVFHLYVEGSGEGTSLPLVVTAHYTDSTAVDTATVWTDTISLPRHGALFSGVAVVPITRIGIGSASLTFKGPSGDSSRAPVFVGFGEDLAVGSYEQMLDYLKYFPAHDRVDALRKVPPPERSAAWAEFVRVADPEPATPQNEALDTYFSRVRTCNDRFLGEGIPGWQSDRGMVYLSIGEPDQSYQQGSMRLSNRGGQQIWIYRQYNVQLTFEDVNGRGRYKLTPRSQNEFQSLMKRIEGPSSGNVPKGTG